MSEPAAPPSAICTHLSDIDKKVLSKLAGLAVRQGGHFVEIGSYLGASATILARAAVPHGVTVHCIDPWTNFGMSEGPRDTYAEFTRNVHAYSQVIHPIRSESAPAASGFAHEVDFLFIDGDHSYEGCARDLECWLPKLREGGIVALHDFSWADGVRDAVRDRLWPAQTDSGHWEGNIYWTTLRREALAPRAVARLKTSLVIPTIKRESHRPSWLETVARNNADGEVLIVYTGQSSAPTGSPPPTGVREIGEPTPGLLAGRHRGFREAAGEVLVYLDDDVSLDVTWLHEIQKPFADPAVEIVGARYLPDYEATPPAWLESLWCQTSEGRHLAALSLLDYGTQNRAIDPTMIWGLCYAIRRDTLRKLGGFHPDGYSWELRRFRGDGETAPSQLAAQLRLRTRYQGTAIVRHAVPTARMKLEYFERRSHMQGISDSYTEIRREGAARPQAPLWKRIARGARDRVRRHARAFTGRPFSIAERSAQAYHAGFQFHQAEVRRDPQLLAWVLRPHYWDYSLPS